MHARLHTFPFRRLAPLVVGLVTIATALAQNPVVALADSTALSNHGEQSIANPQVYIDFWGNDWNGWIDSNGYSTGAAMTYITSFFQNVGGSPWLGTLKQYGVNNNPGQLKGTWIDSTNPVPTGSFTKFDVANEVAYHAGPHFRGETSLDAVIFVFTGPADGQPSDDGGCGAYHDAASQYGSVAYPNPATYAFSYMPYQPYAPALCPSVTTNTGWWDSNGYHHYDSFGHGYFDSYSVGGGHEYAEALTDPMPNTLFNGWWSWHCPSGLLSCTEDEIGDKCASGTDEAPTYGDVWLGNEFFAVQGLWSNATASCSMGAGWHTIDRLLPNETLRPGQELVSLPSTKYTLIMQGDGNLVLYSPTTYLWASWTQNHGGAWAVNQGSDGNFVVYSSTFVALWYSHTQGHIGDVLVMQVDGNLVIYAPGAVAVWSSRTCCNRA